MIFEKQQIVIFQNGHSKYIQIVTILKAKRSIVPPVAQLDQRYRILPIDLESHGQKGQKLAYPNMEELCEQSQ